MYRVSIINLFTGIVSQANTLLEQLNAGSPIGCVEDINSQVYVTLFEGLCGEKLNGEDMKTLNGNKKKLSQREYF